MRKFAAAAALAALIATPALAELALTPAQTEGPYYPARMKPAETDNDLTRLGNGPLAKGDMLDIQGAVVDTAGQPIAGARVEIWQTDHQGIYLHPGDANMAKRDTAFQFYGVATSDAAGAFAFRTIIPARYPGRSRHIHAKITPPGGATLTTQFYFQGDSDLARDGIARRLGASLADVTLSPSRKDATEPLAASVRIVLRPSKRS